MILLATGLVASAVSSILRGRNQYDSEVEDEFYEANGAEIERRTSKFTFFTV